MKKKLKEDISQQIRIVSTQGVMRSQIIADTLNITPVDLESLEILFREGRVTAGRIAQHTGLSTGAITGLLDRLVRAGYVTRELDPKDRRRVLAALNMKKVSKEVLPLYDSIARAVDSLLDEYSEKDLQIILGFLKRAVSIGQEDLAKIRQQ